MDGVTFACSERWNVSEPSTLFEPKSEKPE